MQASRSNNDLKKRAEYYSALLLSGQQPRGKPYHGVKRVYQIFFLNCVLFPHSGKLSRRYFFQEEDHERLSESVVSFYSKRCYPGPQRPSVFARVFRDRLLIVQYRH